MIYNYFKKLEKLGKMSYQKNIYFFDFPADHVRFWPNFFRDNFNHFFDYII